MWLSVYDETVVATGVDPAKRFNMDAQMPFGMLTKREKQRAKRETARIEKAIDDAIKKARGNDCE